MWTEKRALKRSNCKFIAQIKYTRTESKQIAWYPLFAVRRLLHDWSDKPARCLFKYSLDEKYVFISVYIYIANAARALFNRGSLHGMAWQSSNIQPNPFFVIHCGNFVLRVISVDYISIFSIKFSHQPNGYCCWALVIEYIPIDPGRILHVFTCHLYGTVM